MAESYPERLRLLTYMSPEIPLEVFFVLRDCIESATETEVDLIVENRYTGPCTSRTNPFTENLADIVITHSTDYLKLCKAQQPFMELCPVAPVHKHTKVDNRPIYFSEIIINAINKDKFKDIKNLKGCSWAYNTEDSLSGNIVVLNYLKKTLKTNSTYFGSIVKTGSHLESIKQVVEHTVNAAAVDSTVLAGYLRAHEDHADKIISLESLGPLPIYPMLFNTRLSSELKRKIAHKLLSLHASEEWAERLSSIGISCFTSVDPDLYMIEEEISMDIKEMTINTAYY